MTPTEAAALLTVAAAFDNRKPDPDSAKAWSVSLDGYRFEDCRDAIVAHYRASGDWLMPHHVLTAVKRVRARRLEEALEPPPPPELTPLETVAWLQDIRRRIADGEDVSDEGRGELKERDLPGLRALIQRGPVVSPQSDDEPTPDPTDDRLPERGAAR